MSLRHILLGLLEEPLSGYDIKLEFERSLAFFWSANLAQVYPTLKKMQSESLVESWTEPSSKGPDRIVYKRTHDGAEILDAWLKEGPRIETEKRQYVAQVFFFTTLKKTAPKFLWSS